jgi:diguanylate cyclase (GGDEF)-like protein
MLREGDVLARWGGEEFLLVMPSTRLPEARTAIDRIRAQVALPASWVDCPHSRVTFSTGITQVRSTQSLEDALQWADFGLYEAKAQGRDRSVIAESDGIGADRPADYALSA